MENVGASKDTRRMVKSLLVLPAAQGDVYNDDSRNEFLVDP